MEKFVYALRGQPTCIPKQHNHYGCRLQMFKGWGLWNVIYVLYSFQGSRIPHNIVCKFQGFPRIIITFLSSFWETPLKLMAPDFWGSTTYHLQTDGKPKVLDRGILQ